MIGAGFVGGSEEILLGDGEVVFRGALRGETRGDRREREGCDDERFRQ